MPTRYRINIWSAVTGKIMTAGKWHQFVSYEISSKERLIIKDEAPAYEVTLEYSWQD